MNQIYKDFLINDSRDNINKYMPRFLKVKLLIHELESIELNKKNKEFGIKLIKIISLIRGLI